MNKLFNEFKPVSYSEWMAKMEADLKGKPLSLLQSNPEPDLEVVAYHHKENAVEVVNNSTNRNLLKANNNWRIRQAFDSKTDENKTALNALNQGVNAIGIKIDNSENYTKISNNILFEHIYADFSFSDLDTALSLNLPKNSIVNFDSIKLNAMAGEHKYKLTDYYRFYNHFSAHKSIWVTGFLYGEAGASTIQELAFTLSHLNEYIQFLTDQGISLQEINSKICVELSVNENYFVNIAKFRAIKTLVHLLFEGYNNKYKAEPVLIYATTNKRHLAKNDKNNNPLRETSQAMSAVVGGCDVLTINYGKTGTNSEIDRFARIAKNIQLVLKEEAFLDKVNDPGAGSYYIESLTQQLITKSWSIFLEIETNNGLINSLKQNSIQNKIENNKAKLIADLQNNTRTFLGVNKHANAMEKWVDVQPSKPKKGIDFKPIEPFYLENHFVKNTATQ